MQMSSSPMPRQRSARRLFSVQAQMTLGTGFIVFLAVVIGLIGFVSLRNLQQNVNTSLTVANTVNQLGLAIQTQFLLARQNEASLLNRWRFTGFNAEISSYVSGNENRLADARAYLDQLETVARTSPDNSIQSLQAEIDALRPLLDQYEDAFQSTVSTLRERTRPEGAENQMRSEIALLEAKVSPLSPKFNTLVLEIRLNQEAYFASNLQEYADNVRIKVNQLTDAVLASRPADLAPSGMTDKEIVAHADAYMDAFTRLAALEQSAQINANLFREITEDINRNVDRMGVKSRFGLQNANANLEAVSANSTLALGITVIVALGAALIGSVLSVRQVVGPIQRLSVTAEALGRGELSTRAGLEGGAELVKLAETLNTMAAQLQETLTSLEQRVAERTLSLERRSSQLQAASEIARDAASIRDPNELMTRAVNLIREGFGFYHAGLFLLDERGEYAVLRAATGEAGHTMLEQSHRLRVGETGIVGFVAATGQPRIALDVGADAVHFRNPLLPETRSEMGLPLKVGRQVIGVLDVQSREPSAFKEDDITTLQIMADQLAVAIENARLFQQAEASLKQLETLYGRYSQQAWERLAQLSGLRGYHYDRSDLLPLAVDTHPARSPLEAARPPVTIPLRVRGQVIGALDVWPESESWSPEDTALLEEISNRVSQTLESARIFEEAQARAMREQTLNQFTARFTRSLDLDSLLATAARELGQMPDVAEVAIHLRPPETLSSADAVPPPEEASADQQPPSDQDSR